MFQFPVNSLVTRQLRNKNLRETQELSSIPGAREAALHQEVQKPESCYLTSPREPPLQLGLPWVFSFSFSGLMTRNPEVPSSRTAHKIGQSLRYEPGKTWNCLSHILYLSGAVRAGCWNHPLLASCHEFVELVFIIFTISYFSVKICFFSWKTDKQVCI